MTRAWGRGVRQGTWSLGLLALASGLWGCGESRVPPCQGDSNCSEGTLCVDGACILAVDACMDADGDGYGDGPRCEGPDCDDADPTSHADAAELCGDSADNDCDRRTDEGFETLGANCVGGTGTCAAAGVLRCSEAGTVLVCDATPGMAGTESCNGLDDDCDSLVDEPGAGGADCSCLEGETQPCWPGDPETRSAGICRDGVQTCGADGAWGACEGAVAPAVEACNGRDDDCNGLTDDLDTDGDTYFRCPGVSDRDCDDGNGSVYPGRIEECNTLDDNCNGLIDEEVSSVFFLDLDGDGYGGAAASVSACAMPMGYANIAGDCNDSNADIFPGTTEVCNDADDDCNGLIDDGLPLLDIYADNDGDGWAPVGVEARRRCGVPLGFAVSRDPDMNGTPNWDCDDSRATVHPTASETCDGVDNDCDEVVDRWCAEVCPGSWPVNVTGNTPPFASVADMDQDGAAEIALGNSTGAMIVSHHGDVLWQTTGAANTLRRTGVFADVDRSGSYTRNLEWIGGPNSQLTVLRLTPTGIESIPTAASYGVYDAGSYAARDLDGDGYAEIVTMDWNGSVRVSSYDAATGRVVERALIAAPNGRPIYTNGFGLADTTGDGRAEIVFGTGYSQSFSPSTWSGDSFAYSYARASGAATGTLTNACPGCFVASMPGLFAGSVNELLVHDFDGDGVSEVTAEVSFFSSNTDAVPNPGAGSYLFRFDPRTGAAIGAPAAGSLQVAVDLDGAAPAERTDRNGWYFDVDGDGDQDLVGIAGNGPILRFRTSATTLVDGPRAASTNGGGVRFVGDLDGDDRLDALVADGGTGRMHCVRFGPGTYHPYTSWGTGPRGVSVRRTGQLDEGEPNETAESTSLVTNDGLLRGFITSASDVDWIRYEGYAPRIVVRAPRSHGLRVRTHAMIGTTLTLLAEITIPAGGSATRQVNVDDPARASLRLAPYYFEIRGEGGASSSDPYLLDASISF